jgi:phosphotransferase system HPr-like phosphotransfer protein
LDVLYLAAPPGASLVLEAEGEDAPAALDALASLFDELGREG